MKRFSQFIALNAPVANPLNVMTALVRSLTSLKTSLITLSNNMRWRKGKKAMALENDVWAIE